MEVYVVLCLFLVVSTSAINCLERLVSEMTCCVEWDVKPYTLTHSIFTCIIYDILSCDIVSSYVAMASSSAGCVVVFTYDPVS